MNGFFENITDGYANGWIFFDETPQPVSLLHDGKILQSFRPTIHRPDLVEIAGEENRAGFRVSLRGIDFGDAGEVEVSVCVEGRPDLVLPGSPIVVRREDLEGGLERCWLGEYGSVFEESWEEVELPEGYVVLEPKSGRTNAGAIRRLREFCDTERPVAVYGDCDVVDRHGIHEDPWFKPEWDGTLARETGYVDGLILVREDVFDPSMRDLANPRVDTLLGLADAGHEVRRIPEVLWHWDLERVNWEPLTTKAVDGASDLLASIIIPTKDAPDFLIPCVEGILKRTVGARFEVVLVDHETTDERAREFLDGIESRDSRVRVVQYEGAFNYPALNHCGVAASRGDVLVFLNNDTEVLSENWLERMVAQISRDEVGAVGAKLLYDDGTVQHAGVVLGVMGGAFHAHDRIEGDEEGYMGLASTRHEVSCVTGACMAVRRDVFDEVGGFNEEHLAVALNDVDLCLKIREAGWKIIFEPEALLTHHKSKSRADDRVGEHAERFEREKAYMWGRWRQELENDPYYHPIFARDVPPYLAIKELEV